MREKNIDVGQMLGMETPHMGGRSLNSMGRELATITQTLRTSTYLCPDSPYIVSS